MSLLSTTKMSSRGQVVIPEEIRKHLNLTVGTQFIVVAHDDALILKVITPPKLSDLKEVLDKIQVASKAAGITTHDLEQTIKKVRKK